ncbi:MAG: hypothetical protein KAH54_00085 [Candidatus Sabulitectum sp.]|nr:hypothetical protein [Candidatus Sabulitectum sp.]
MNTVSCTLLIILATVLFQDDFNDGTAEGWYTVGPSNYQVQDGRYHFSGGGAVNDATSYRGESGEVMSTSDYSMQADIEIDVGVFGGMMTRYWEDGEYNMMLVLSIPHQALNLYRWHWTSIVLVDSYSFPVQAGTTYTVKMQCSGDTFAGRAWLPGESEPEGWFVSVTDTLSRPGAAALFTAGTSKNTDVYMSCFFDNAVVETPEPWSLTQNTWAGIKALGSLPQ